MDIIGVIDIRDGQAVHAVAGERERYAPVRTAAGVTVAGDAVALARVYRDRLRVRELYVADLDAIIDARPQDDLVRRVIGAGIPVWLDAAIASVEQAQRVARLGAARVVVGLETLESWPSLAGIVTAAGSGRVVFSLDLRARQPLGPLASGAGTPADIVLRVRGLGVATVCVIDLARVGAGTGPDLDVLAAIRGAAPGVRLAAGGGVRGVRDLEALSAIGCDAALVATALHDGGVDATAVASHAWDHRNVSR